MTFDEFIASIEDPELRDALLGSVPLLIAMVVGADRVFDELEMQAAVEVLISAEKELGPAFRYSPAAQTQYDRLCATARDAGPGYFAERLALLREVVREMPDDLRGRYQGFVHALCLRLARASGGFFWFGDPISDEEKVALRKIAAAIGVRFGDLDEGSPR